MKQQKRPTPRSGKQDAGLLVAGAGFEPATFGLCIPATAFAAGSHAVCGLDFLFTLGRTVRGLPSSLYTFLESRLGSGLPVKASPNLTGDHARVSLCAAHAHASLKEHTTPIEPDELPAAPPRVVRCIMIRTGEVQCNGLVGIICTFGQ